MAYLDQRSGTNQRALIATAVILLEGAAILALINGLAVHFLPPPPEHRTIGETIDMPLPPPPPMPEEAKQPPPKEPTASKEQQPQTDAIPLGKDAHELGNPTHPDIDLPTGTGPDVIILPPKPPLSPFTPQAARPSNDPASWIGHNDYPSHDLRLGHQGNVGFRLTISTNGKVESCAVTQSSGYRGLDEAACKYISKRARFEPATDSNGSRVTGTYSNRVTWVIPRD